MSKASKTKKIYKYEVYWDITVDGEGMNIKLKEPWESELSDPEEVMLEVDADPDLMGFDFDGYPEDPDDLEIVWEGFPIVVPIEDDKA